MQSLPSLLKFCNIYIIYLVFVYLIATVLCCQRRQWHPTPVLLPVKSHGQRSLVGCSLWGHEQSDTTERLHFDFSLSCIGEGNGNPLQCSCVQNPRDGGAWWAAVYGLHRVRHDWSDLAAATAVLCCGKDCSTHLVIKLARCIFFWSLSSCGRRQTGSTSIIQMLWPLQ